MIPRLVIILLMLTNVGVSHAQSSLQYKDFILHNNDIWALSNNGRLYVFDLQQSLRRELPCPDNGEIMALSKDEKGDPVIGTRSRHIRVYDSARHTWKDLGQYSGRLYAITFDSRNNCYLVTSGGLVDLYQRKTYWPDTSVNKSFFRVDFRTQLLSAWHMDKQDDLWLGFNMGEWGGDLFIFDTQLKRWHMPALNAYDMEPVWGICTDSAWTYLSMGLAHFSTSGSILKIRYYCSTRILESMTVRNEGSTDYGEYIGPIALNPVDHSLWFYSDNGFFRGRPEKDLSTMAKWEHMAKPLLFWSSGQSMAMGSPMNVRKMLFTMDGRLIFLSQLNGMVLVNGHDVCYLP